MSYARAADFQASIFGLLTGWPDLAGIAVLDAIPPGGGAGTYVLIGPEDVSDASDKSGGGAVHRFVISVISDAAGFTAAKTVAAAVCDALVDAQATMTQGRVVSVLFTRAVAKRLDDGSARRIDLTFRARLEC